MSAQRINREMVCAAKRVAHQGNLKAKMTAPVSAIASAMFCLGLVSYAQGAAETALKEANTSIGVLPTTTTNKWKLITDPVLDTPAAPDEIGPTTIMPNLYVPIAGSLSNSYDPTMFHLATDAAGDYENGVTVEGILPFDLIGFDVLMNGGGNIDVVVDPSNPAVDTITKTGDVTDGEAGTVDIQFALVGDLRSEALPANLDADFFDVVLLDNPGVTGPPTGRVFAGPDDSITLGPIDPTNPNSPSNVVITADEINPMSTPEPGSAVLMVVSAAFMGLRRRKASVQI